MSDVIYEVYWEPVCARLWKMLKKCKKDHIPFCEKPS